MKELSKYKKGQQTNISQIGVIAMSLIVAVIVLGLGATILDKIQTTQTVNTGSHANDSCTYTTNNTICTLSAGNSISSTVVVWNQSTLVNLGNYTVSGDTVTLTEIDTEDGPMNWSFATGGVNISYDYTLGGSAYNASGYGLSGMVTLAEFVPTIAIVAVAAIIIGIIMVFFGRRKM